MARVTGITAAKAEEIANAVLVSADADVDGQLVVTRGDGTTITIDQVAAPFFAEVPGKVTLKAFDATDIDVVVPEWAADGRPTEGFVPPSVTLTSRAMGVAWSPDGKYAALGLVNSPYVAFLKRSTIDAEDFTLLANPTSLPSGSGARPQYSFDGTYLALPYSAGLIVYKRTGVNVHTRLTDPTGLTVGAGAEVSWTEDAVYLAIVGGTAPYLNIYKRSGDTFNKLADPASTPAGLGNACDFSSSGTYLAVGHQTTPRLTVYKRSGDVFTKLADPASVPTGTVNGLSWSPDDQYLAVAQSFTPYVTIYKRNGDVLTKLPDPVAIPAGSGFSTAWSPDGRYLAVSHSTSPNMLIYKRFGDEFRVIQTHDTVMGGAPNDLDWSPDGTALLAGGIAGAGPFVNFYRSQMLQPPGLSVRKTLIP